MPPPLIPTPLSQPYHPPQSSSIPIIPPQSSSIPIIPPQSSSIPIIPQQSSSILIVPLQTTNVSNLLSQPSNFLNVQPQSCSILPSSSYDPFWVCFIFGNVSRCHGCKGRISRSENKSPLPPPDDIVLGHKEHVVYQNARSGRFEQSLDKRNVYYHPWRSCIVPNFANFNAILHINMYPTVRSQLLPQHKSLLWQEFGLTI